MYHKKGETSRSFIFSTASSFIISSFSLLFLFLCVCLAFFPSIYKIYNGNIFRAFHTGLQASGLQHGGGEGRRERGGRGRCFAVVVRSKTRQQQGSRSMENGVGKNAEIFASDNIQLEHSYNRYSIASKNSKGIWENWFGSFTWGEFKEVDQVLDIDVLNNLTLIRRYHYNFCNLQRIRILVLQFRY